MSKIYFVPDVHLQEQSPRSRKDAYPTRARSNLSQFKTSPGIGASISYQITRNGENYHSPAQKMTNKIVENGKIKIQNEKC